VQIVTSNIPLITIQKKQAFREFTLFMFRPSGLKCFFIFLALVIGFEYVKIKWIEPLHYQSSSTADKR